MVTKNSAWSLRTRLLACGGTLALAAAAAIAAPAFAQTSGTDTTAAATPAAPATGDTVVVVRGIKKGIQDAISAKKTDSSIIEAVSAEDVGKLPDDSIAESIARLPGVAAQRDKGRAQTLSIRGLGPDFTVTTFNGREQASTNDNRSVEYDQYPSELISQVKVYKTPDAGMSYQGIAGTAELETVRPLAYGKRTFAVGVKEEANSLKLQVPGNSTTGNRYNLAYIDQFFDKTLGVAIGYAHTKAPYQAQTYESWGYATCGGCAAADQNDIVNGGEKDGIESSYYQRDSLMGVVEYKPNDRLHMVLDAFHSDFTEIQTIRRMEFGTQWGSGSAILPGYTTSNGRVTSGEYDNETVILENYANERHAKVDNMGLNTVYKLNDQWTLENDLSYSKVHRTDLRLESTGGTGANGSVVKDNVKFTTNSDGVTIDHTSLDYSSFATDFLTDPGGWGGPNTRAGYLGNPTVNDEIKAVRLSAKRVLGGGIFSDISFGVNFSDRTKSKYEWQGMLINKTSPAETVPTAFQTGVVNTDFLGNSHGMISYDALALYKSGFWSVTDARVDPLANVGDRIFDITQSWQLEEKLTTLYVKADIKSVFFGLPVTGNIGIQSQGADQQVHEGESPGVDTHNNLIVTYVDRGAKYNDILPSMNLNFDLGHDTHLRLAAATALARPQMDDMAGGLSVSAVSNTNAPAVIGGDKVYWTASGGNPNLRPWKANDYDLSLEKYFGRKAYLSAAVYYKDLKSYIYTQNVKTDFSNVPLPGPTHATDPVTCPTTTSAGCYDLAVANRQGYTSVQANGQGGYVEGLELTASLPGDLLMPQLDGFGVILSAAYNKSEIKPDGINKTTLPGLSPSVLNETIYYEKHGFSFRVSQRYRGAFLGEVPNFDSSLGSQWVASESIIDAQVGYTFSGGPLNGLSINFAGSNLNNRPFVYYAGKGQTQNVLKYEKYGADYLLSVNMKF